MFLGFCYNHHQWLASRSGALALGEGHIGRGVLEGFCEGSRLTQVVIAGRRALRRCTVGEHVYGADGAGAFVEDNLQRKGRSIPIRQASRVSDDCIQV